MGKHFKVFSDHKPLGNENIKARADEELDRTWLIKFCPKGVLENYEATCIAHCWWNGWQGGMCTNDNICVCKWEGILEDLDATGANSLRLKGVSNTTGDPNVEAGDGAPVDEEKPAEPADDEGRK
ncbi:hypothetical protein HHI36_014375 [Cryptolaemus montrouzieri]|uniref:Invertebrate defensins family profile domain-containing protein n=1 Tax=Cryptolaemus montrouzieri TaxID=559131 RepID=A0ABD2N2D9_9CUCU